MHLRSRQNRTSGNMTRKLVNKNEQPQHKAIAFQEMHQLRQLHAAITIVVHAIEEHLQLWRGQAEAQSLPAVSIRSFDQRTSTRNGCQSRRVCVCACARAVNHVNIC